MIALEILKEVLYIEEEIRDTITSRSDKQLKRINYIKEAIEELEAIKCYICDIEAIVNKRKVMIMEAICGKDK